MFLLRLSVDLGTPVRQLLKMIDARDLEDYRVLYSQPSESWQQAAQVCATVANFAPVKKKRVLTPDDFIPAEFKKKKTLFDTLADHANKRG